MATPDIHALALLVALPIWARTGQGPSGPGPAGARPGAHRVGLADDRPVGVARVAEPDAEGDHAPGRDRVGRIAGRGDGRRGVVDRERPRDRRRAGVGRVTG